MDKHIVSLVVSRSDRRWATGFKFDCTLGELSDMVQRSLGWIAKRCADPRVTHICARQINSDGAKKTYARIGSNDDGKCPVCVL